MKTLVVVGTGHRCYENFVKKIHNTCSDKIKIVGLCDKNIKRCEFYRDTVDPEIKVYSDFDTMMDELKPDAVMIGTVDATHHEFIIKSLKRGCEVFCEKPITVNEENCLAIREAEKESGKKVNVTFNCRFMPYFAKLKEIISTGVIGKPLAINYEYLLNTSHGGDYFKRWHRFMANSGGMMVHKATHHFDIVNWILEDDPVSVSAHGARLYYGNDDRKHGERCSECPYASECEIYLDIVDDDFYKNLYYKTEDVDGYIRDHCSFKGDTDIYDLMSVSVTYKKGTILTYSLNLFSTDEGYNLNIVGEKGRIELSTFFSKDLYKIIIRLRDGSVNELTFPIATGTHAGGDDRMIAMLFGGLKEDPLGQCSNSFDGVKSAMIGIAANRSIKEGTRIELTPILDKMR